MLQQQRSGEGGGGIVAEGMGERNGKIEKLMRRHVVLFCAALCVSTISCHHQRGPVTEVFLWLFRLTACLFACLPASPPACLDDGRKFAAIKVFVSIGFNGLHRVKGAFGYLGSTLFATSWCWYHQGAFMRGVYLV